MANFTNYEFADALAFDRAARNGEMTFAYNPEVPVTCAYVERAGDNSGTFLFTANHDVVGFVSNSHSVDGEWLYYSDDVAKWLMVA